MPQVSRSALGSITVALTMLAITSGCGDAGGVATSQIRQAQTNAGPATQAVVLAGPKDKRDAFGLSLDGKGYFVHVPEDPDDPNGGQAQGGVLAATGPFEGVATNSRAMGIDPVFSPRSQFRPRPTDPFDPYTFEPNDVGDDCEILAGDSDRVGDLASQLLARSRANIESLKECVARLDQASNWSYFLCGSNDSNGGMAVIDPPRLELAAGPVDLRLDRPRGLYDCSERCRDELTYARGVLADTRDGLAACEQSAKEMLKSRALLGPCAFETRLSTQLGRSRARASILRGEAVMDLVVWDACTTESLEEQCTDPDCGSGGGVVLASLDVPPSDNPQAPSPDDSTATLVWQQDSDYARELAPYFAEAAERTKRSGQRRQLAKIARRLERLDEADVITLDLPTTNPIERLLVAVSPRKSGQAFSVAVRQYYAPEAAANLTAADQALLRRTQALIRATRAGVKDPLSVLTP